MATINYKYEEDLDLYNSGTVEEDLLEIYKKNQEPDIEKYFYSTVDIRENILNWYPFKKNSTILEIGGGLGSITGCLCKNAKKVVSCEYSKRRAEVLYQRHKKNENLEVIVGNFRKVDFQEKFDYIVLIGVFEYAKRFYNSEKPFYKFLNDMKKILKPDGIILIVIENRYGIKYFAGATEEHTGIKYKGIYGYDDVDVQTFGQKEIINIITESDFENFKFYYPYPDYKMPYLIYTDERLPLITELPSLKLYNHGSQLYNFDYRRILAGIIQNDQYGFFANSFLLEIGKNSKNFSDVKYVKTSWHRAKNYQVNTIIKDNNIVVKVPKYPDAVKHLDKMIEIHNRLANLGLETCDISKQNGEYIIEYIDGINLYEYIENLIKNNDKINILNELDKYHELLKSISYFGKIKNYVNEEIEDKLKKKDMYILKLNLFDLQLSNIIKKEEKYYVIDQEWISKYSIPLKYMMYYSLYYLFEWTNIISLFSKKEIYDRYEISNEEMKIYDFMSEIFSKEELSNVNIPIHKITEIENEFVLIDSKVEELSSKLISTKANFSNQLEVLKKQNIDLNQQLENLNVNNNILSDNYNKLINSKRWRITRKLFLLIDKVRYTKK